MRAAFLGRETRLAQDLRAGQQRCAALLTQREEEASALAAIYADALAWKQEGNRLRMRIGALLIEQGDALGVASPKEFARSFFGQ